MKALGLGLKNELYKLSCKKKYIVFLIIGIVFCASRIGGGMVIEKLSSGTVTIKSSVILDMLPFTVKILVPLIIFLAATDLFADEFMEDTIKGVLVQPITRFGVMFSKAFAIFILGAVYFTAMYAICLILQLISGAGFTNAATAAFAYALDLIPMISTIALAILINMLIKTPGLTMLISIAVYALMMYLNYFSFKIGQALFTAYLEWHKLIIGTALPLPSLMAKAGIILGSALILFSLSYIIFDKRDI